MTRSPTNQAPLALSQRNSQLFAACMWLVLWGIAVGLTLTTVVKYTNHQGGDFHNHFYPAAQMLVTGEWRFMEPTATGTFNTLYLPVTFLLFVPLSQLPYLVAAAIWSIFSVVCLLLAVTLGARLVGKWLQTRIDSATLPTAAALTIGLLLSKILVDLNLGQIDLLLGLLLVLSAILLPHRSMQAGVVLAVVASFKIIGLLFLPWLLLRRAWRAAAALVVTYVFLWMIMTPWLGWRVASEYFSLMVGNDAKAMPMGFAIDSSVETKSFSATAGLQRMFATWDMNPGIAIPLVFVSAVGLFVWYLYRRNNRPLFDRRINEDRSLDLTEFACLPAASIVFHTYSHNRHWCFAILLFLILANLLIVPGPRRSRALLLVITSLAMLQQIRVPDAVGLGEAWDRFGGTGWVMLAVLLSVLWAVLRDDPSMRPQAPDHSSSSMEDAACLAARD
jgi:hypothetical protein